MTKIEKLEDKVIFDPNAEDFTVPDGGEIVDKDGEKFLKITPNGWGTTLNLTSHINVKGYTKMEVKIYADESSDDWQMSVKLCDYSSADLTDEQKKVAAGAVKAKTDIQTISAQIENDGTVTAVQPATQEIGGSWPALSDKVIYIGKIIVKTE